MPAPTIISSSSGDTVGGLGVPSSNHSYTYPGGVQGDRFLLFVGTETPNVINWGLTGWTLLSNSANAGQQSVAVYYRDDTGQSGSFGGQTTDDGAQPISCINSYVCLKISGDDPPSYDFAFNQTGAVAAAVNTPNVSFAPSSEDALALTAYFGKGAIAGISPPPLLYTLVNGSGSGGGLGNRCYTEVAARDVFGTSEDPNTWPVAETRVHVGYTVVIREARPKTQVASDDFNRANGNLTTPWVQINSTWGNVEIVSNEIDSTASGSGIQRAAARYDDVFADDQYSEIEVRALAFQGSNESIGVICRASTDVNVNRDYYFANVYLDSPGPTYTTVFGRINNNAETIFHSALVRWSVGDVLGLECKDTEIRVTQNGVKLGGSFVEIDTGIDSLSSGDAGVTMAGSAGKADNWVAGNLVAAVSADVDLSHYRWANQDNPAHELSTFAAAEDTALGIDVTSLPEQYHLVLKLGNEGNATETDDFFLEFRKNGGAWTDVDTEQAGGPVSMFDGPDTDGATSATERLTTTPETHQGSVYREVDNRIATDIPAGLSYEFYYSVSFNVDVTNAGDVFEFRVLADVVPLTQDVTPTVNITSAAVADVDLSHFRWSDDDNVAHEATTFLAAEDTALNVDVVTDLGSGFNLAVKLGNEGGATETDDFQLQYNKNGGGWNNVDGTSVPVRMFNGQDTDGATSATERLTTTPETHQGSVYEEVDGLITTDIPNGQSFEFYFCIEFVTGQNVNGDSYQFRILEGVTPITQDVIPSVNIISSAVANVDLAHYRWADDDNIAHEAATFLAAEDTSYEVLQGERGTGLHLVVKLHNDGSAAETENFQLQYNKDGGGWANVNATSNDVRSFNGQDTDGATSATERLSVVPETHIGSVYDEVDGLIVTDIAANNSYEFYFCIEFRTADNLGGESYEFRVLAGAAPITQDFIPAATIESLVELGGITLVNSEFDPAKIRRLTV